jgi:uncharacterized membrane protein (DUF106 family)
MNMQEFQNKYMTTKFISLYIVIFIILFIFCSLIKFIGQFPVLIVFTFFVAYYINNTFQKKYNDLYPSES